MAGLAVKLLSPLLFAPAIVSATPAQHGPVYAGLPPERYWQQEAFVPTLYVNDVTQYCGKPAAGTVRIACTIHLRDGRTFMVLPQPCAMGHLEIYAVIVCHEKSHSLGWGRNHEL